MTPARRGKHGVRRLGCAHQVNAGGWRRAPARQTRVGRSWALGRRTSAAPEAWQTDVSRSRVGATLTEILMAILIMSVGIVSVATLFPISVLRTIKATQQTNSKIHKLNASELVKSVPGVLTAFQTGTTVPGSGTPLRYRSAWQPQTPYAVDDVIVPTIKPGQVRPTPLVLYRAAAVSGNSGTTEPDWLPQSLVVESNGQIAWEPLLNGLVPLSYVVDPLGWNIANDDATSPPALFGNKTNRTTGVGIAPPTAGLLRIHGGLDTAALASAAVALPDAWEEIVSGTPASATNTAVSFPATIALDPVTVPSAQAVPRRISLTSTDGRMTVYRTITNIAGQTVNLAEPVPLRFPRDAGGNPDVGMARVESLTRRYTWFLTVRNNAQGLPTIKCVVVFNRNFASASEHVYDANFGNVNGDVDSDGNPDGAQHGLTHSAWVKIVWDRATEPDPLLKRGNYVFDAQDVTWYRIQEVFDGGPRSGFAVLILDRNVRRGTVTSPGHAVLMPGVVEVFDL